MNEVCVSLSGSGGVKDGVPDHEELRETTVSRFMWGWLSWSRWLPQSSLARTFGLSSQLMQWYIYMSSKLRWCSWGHHLTACLCTLSLTLSFLLIGFALAPQLFLQGITYTILITVCYKMFATKKFHKSLAKWRGKSFVNRILRMSQPDCTILKWPHTLEHKLSSSLRGPCCIYTMFSWLHDTTV